MSQINIGSVLKGGLAAGLIMNVSEFILNVPVAGAQMETELAAQSSTGQHGRDRDVYGVTFLSIATVWLCAINPPRPARRRQWSPASLWALSAPTPRCSSCSAQSLAWSCSGGVVDDRNVIVSRRLSVFKADPLFT